MAWFLFFGGARLMITSRLASKNISARFYIDMDQCALTLLCIFATPAIAYNKHAVDYFLLIIELPIVEVFFKIPYTT